MLLTRNLFAVRAASAALSRCGLGAVHRTAVSLRDGSALCATKDGAPLSGELGWEHLVQSTLFRRSAPEDREAFALVTHRVIYSSTHHRALVQTTPPAALAMTAGKEGPLELEGSGRIPVLEPDSKDLPELLARALRASPLVLVRGQAAYAAAQEPEAAARLICELEERATSVSKHPR